jgi:hypothetical protein
LKKFQNIKVKYEKKSAKENKSIKSKKEQKKLYFHRKNNKKSSKVTSDWMLRLRPRINFTIPESSIKKYKRKINSN